MGRLSWPNFSTMPAARSARLPRVWRPGWPSGGVAVLQQAPARPAFGTINALWDRQPGRLRTRATGPGYGTFRYG